MSSAGSTKTSTGSATVKLPENRGLYYGGAWHVPSHEPVELFSPGSGRSLGTIAMADASDAEAAIAAARAAFSDWRDVHPLERARLLREIASVIRDHAEEFAMIDAEDCGNPARAMVADSHASAAQFEFFAGLVTEMKGTSIPMGANVLNTSVREPMGVIARIIAFNHPFMFCAGKSAAPLAAGNTVIIKPPEQAPLSALRFAELIEGILPPGALNILPGGAEAGQTLASHPDVAKVGVIGSVGTGRAVLSGAAGTIKPALLELGGKNALIAFGDADPDTVASALIDGMNFTWCGQSCGSTSRAFLHESIHDAVLQRLVKKASTFKPGDPTSHDTMMGALISKAQHRKVLDYIEIGKNEGANLLYGGKIPDDPSLSNGFFVEPTIFSGVTMDMRIAREEIFGPVLSVLKWSDATAMLKEVNGVEYGLTCSIWTDNLHHALNTANAVETGYVWINEVGKHFLGAPFGGYKQSGMGREECLQELLEFTREKNIHIRLNRHA